MVCVCMSVCKRETEDVSGGTVVKNPCRGHGFEPWSRKIPHAASHEAGAPQLLSLHSRACEPQQLKPERPRICALQQEKPLQ